MTTNPGLAPSKLFDTPVGTLLQPRDVPPSNYLTDGARYDYEGNWVFARFDSDVVYGARFGFGRGKLALGDWGTPLEVDHSFLFTHIELMTREGAWLWQCGGRYKAQEVAIESGRMGLRLPGVFDIAGWPAMRWRMNSEDDSIGVDMQVDLTRFITLPDNVMQNNLFAMWVTTADLRGSVRFEGQKVDVAGFAMYDHPRINVGPNDVPRYGWYLYTPARFEDGSVLLAYYAEDADRRPVPASSYAAYVDAAGRFHWLTEVSVQGLVFDADRKPQSWTLECRGQGVSVRADARVRSTSVRRAWGGPTVPATRREVGNVPLVADVSLTRSGRSVAGSALVEYIPHESLTDTLAAAARR